MEDCAVLEWILEYILDKTFRAFESRQNIQCLEMIDGILTWAHHLGTTQYKEGLSSDIQEKLNILLFMCRLQDGENYTIHFDGMKTGQTVLEDALDILERLRSKTNAKLVDGLKMQAIFVPCRHGDFDTAQRLYHTLYQDSTSVTTKEANDRIRKVVYSRKTEHPTLLRESYQSFLITASNCLWETIQHFPEPLLKRLVSEQRSPGTDLVLSHSVLNKTRSLLKVTSCPRDVAQHKDLQPKLEAIRRDREKLLDRIPPPVSEVYCGIMLPNKSNNNEGNVRKRRPSSMSGRKSHGLIVLEDADEPEIPEKQAKKQTAESTTSKKKPTIDVFDFPNSSSRKLRSNLVEDEDWVPSSRPETGRTLCYAPNRNRPNRHQVQEQSSEEDDDNIDSASAILDRSLAKRVNAPMTLRAPPSPKFSTDSTTSRMRTPWTLVESLKLFKAVQKVGEGNWREAQKRSKLDYKTNIQLKDRWRTIKKDTSLFRQLQLAAESPAKEKNQ